MELMQIGYDDYTNQPISASYLNGCIYYDINGKIPINAIITGGTDGANLFCNLVRLTANNGNIPQVIDSTTNQPKTSGTVNVRVYYAM